MFKVANNAESTLASNISGGATSLTVDTGDGALFPTTGSGSYFYIRLGSDQNNEVVKVTSRSGDVFTCEATSSGWSGGDAVKLTVNKELFDDIPRIITTNTTYTIASGGGTFTSVSEALAALNHTFIAQDAIVTLELADGTYVEGATINDTAMSSDRIKIKGANTYTVSMTSVQSSSGSAGAWSVVLNMSSVADIDVGDYVLIASTTGGTLPSYILGCHEVTNVDDINTRITVTSKHRAASAPSGVVAGSVVVIKSIITFSAANVDGFKTNDGRGFYGFENVVIVGGASGSGLLAVNKGCLRIDPDAANKKVGIAGFAYGIQAAKGAFIDATYGIVSGSATSCVGASKRGAVEFANGVATGCGSDGLTTSYAGWINADSGTVTGAGGTNTAYATVCSGVSFVSGTATSPAGVYSPTANSVGNENSYINT